jgi:hypothetical protein
LSTTSSSRPATSPSSPRIPHPKHESCGLVSTGAQSPTMLNCGLSPTMSSHANHAPWCPSRRVRVQCWRWQLSSARNTLTMMRICVTRCTNVLSAMSITSASEGRSVAQGTRGAPILWVRESERVVEPVLGQSTDLVLFASGRYLMLIPQLRFAGHSCHPRLIKITGKGSNQNSRISR